MSKRRSIRDKLFDNIANMKFETEKDERRSDFIEKKVIQIADKLEKFNNDSKSKAQTAVHNRIFGKLKKKKPQSLRKSLIGF